MNRSSADVKTTNVLALHTIPPALDSEGMKPLEPIPSESPKKDSASRTVSTTIPRVSETTGTGDNKKCNFSS